MGVVGVSGVSGGAGPGLVPTNPRTRPAPGGNACSRLGYLRAFWGENKRSNTIQDIRTESGDAGEISPFLL